MAVELKTQTGEQTRARYPDAEGYLERDGVRVFWELYGEGDQTILLLPTWSIVHSRFWKMQIPYLARHCRVLTFDPRGNARPRGFPVGPGRHADGLPSQSVERRRVQPADQCERAAQPRPRSEFHQRSRLQATARVHLVGRRGIRAERPLGAGVLAHRRLAACRRGG